MQQKGAFAAVAKGASLLQDVSLHFQDKYGLEQAEKHIELVEDVARTFLNCTELRYIEISDSCERQTPLKKVENKLHRLQLTKKHDLHVEDNDF